MYWKKKATAPDFIDSSFNRSTDIKWQPSLYNSVKWYFLLDNTACLSAGHSFTPDCSSKIKSQVNVSDLLHRNKRVYNRCPKGRYGSIYSSYTNCSQPWISTLSLFSLQLRTFVQTAVHVAIPAHWYKWEKKREREKQRRKYCQQNSSGLMHVYRLGSSVENDELCPHPPPPQHRILLRYRVKLARAGGNQHYGHCVFTMAVALPVKPAAASDAFW